MAGLDIRYPYVDEHDYNSAYLRRQQDRFIEAVMEATSHAVNEGIKANSIVINTNMVKVPEFTMCDPFGTPKIVPRMICGLNVYLDKLPDTYSFAVLEGPENDRMARFESIGMEPDELRRAAELYRKVREVL